MKNETKVLNYLRSGKALTEAQAKGLFQVGNLSSEISRLRARGHCIFTNKAKTTGATMYRLGRPSRAMVAAAYAIHGSDLFA